jgi:hypothetical protein
MTVTIAGETRQLPPEVGHALQTKARRLGVSIAALFVELASREAAAPEVSDDSLFAGLDALAAQFPTNAAPLADNAVARLYAEQGATQL